MLIIRISLIELLEEHKNNNKESTMKLVKQFTPLIKKYTRLLDYEDAENDLVVHFLEVLNKVPTTKECYALGYISTSIKNIYIKLSQKNNSSKKVLYLYDYKCHDSISTREDNSKKYELMKALSNLEPIQRNIVICTYFYGFRTNELSKMLNVSRQTIYKQKKKALSSLKNQLVAKET